MVYFLLYFVDPEDDDFVEEIIESEDDQKSIGKRNLFPKLKLPIIIILLNSSLGEVEVIEEEDEVVDEVGEVEVPTMGETGNKFNEIILSDDEFDSVVIDHKKAKPTPTPSKPSLFDTKAAKFTSSYEYKSNLSLLHP